MPQNQNPRKSIWLELHCHHLVIREYGEKEGTERLGAGRIVACRSLCGTRDARGAAITNGCFAGTLRNRDAAGLWPPARPLDRGHATRTMGHATSYHDQTRDGPTRDHR